MTKNERRKFWFVYGTLLSVLTLVVGVLFIVQVWAIFRSAPDDPFTTSIIKEKFSKIAVFVWMWVAAVVAGGVLSVCLPEEEVRPKAYTDVKKTLTRLKKVWAADESDLEVLRKKRYVRYIVYGAVGAICLAVIVLCSVWLFNTAYNPSHDSVFFTEHGAVADRLLKMLPWLMLGMVAWAAAVVFHTISLRKETAFVKSRIAASKGKPRAAITQPTEEKKFPCKWKCKWKLSIKNPAKLVFWLRIGLCAVAVVLIVIGIANGGMIDVYEKAKNICTQCIGLG